MTVKRGGSGPSVPLGPRARESLPTTTDAKSTPQTPPPRATGVDAFDGDGFGDPRLSASGSTAVEDLFRDARSRPSLLTSMTRVLSETKCRLEDELAALKVEARAIADDTALPLAERAARLDDVRQRMAKPKKRLISIRRRMSTTGAAATKDSDGALRRARGLLRDSGFPASGELERARVGAALKTPLDASAASAAIRVELGDGADRAQIASTLLALAPSVKDAAALYSALGGAPGAAFATARVPVVATPSGATQVLLELDEARTP